MRWQRSADGVRAAPMRLTERVSCHGLRIPERRIRGLPSSLRPAVQEIRGGPHRRLPRTVRSGERPRPRLRGEGHDQIMGESDDQDWRGDRPVGRQPVVHRLNGKLRANSGSRNSGPHRKVSINPGRPCHRSRSSVKTRRADVFSLHSWAAAGYLRLRNLFRP